MINKLIGSIRRRNLVPLLIAGLTMPLINTVATAQSRADDERNRSSNGPVRLARFSYVSG